MWTLCCSHPLYMGRYLCEAPDRAGFVLVRSPLNAAMWEDMDSLTAWLDGLPAADMDRLESNGFYPLEVAVDWTGCDWKDCYSARKFVTDRLLDTLSRPLLQGTFIRSGFS